MLYLNVNDIMNILGVKKSKAYAIIKQLNHDIHQMGYLTVKGKVPKKYFYEKIYH